MTLTDRYVDAVLRRLPSRQRADIDRELRASIADALDDRMESGTDPAEAEAAVLTELGDPVKLAAGYADGPLHLIGPRFYLDYMRVLKALLATVVPVVAAIVGVLGAIGDKSLAKILGDTLAASVTTALHIAFWTTVIFAVIERTPALEVKTTKMWSLLELPEPPSKRARFWELVTLTAMTVLFTSLLLLSPLVSTEHDADGKPIGLFSPWLWDTGTVYVFIALVIASLGYAFVKYYVRWSVPLAIGGALVDLAPPLLLIWLATSERLLNPAFVEAAGWPDSVYRWVRTGLIIVSLITLIQTISDGVSRARQR